MSNLTSPLRARLAPFWRGSPPLTVVALLMLPALAAFSLALWLDPRTLLGAPLWLKPAKFAASIAIYSATLAWVIAQLPKPSRTIRFVSWLSAVVLVLELLIIGIQAGRGTTSHFNVGTPLDATLFAVMGSAIVSQTIASGFVAVALWRHPFRDRALGWALRLGLTIAIVGASFGGIMTRPTSTQLDALRAGGPRTVIGAHSVGAADGGPGLTGTGWSRQHGDLRVPHFFGLHALQLLPLIALGLRRTRWSETQRSRLMVSAGASYAAFVALLLWQAFRGQSLVAPDATMLGALAAWLALSCLAARVALRGQTSAPATLALTI